MKLKLRLPDLARYGLWGLVAITANANRREYRMSTTWLPHLLTNTLSLLLPDAVRALLRGTRRPDGVVERTAVEMVRDNPIYAVYVAPLALGYVTSHPRFNIYKGDLAEVGFAGFKLDAIPHSATAFALTALIVDTLRTVDAGDQGRLEGLIHRLNQHPALVSLAVLGALTFIWEYGEYRMHVYEMGQRGDKRLINMQWSVDDTATDVASNLIGWALACLWQTRRGR